MERACVGMTLSLHKEDQSTSLSCLACIGIWAGDPDLLQDSFKPLVWEFQIWFASLYKMHLIHSDFCIHSRILRHLSIQLTSDKSWNYLRPNKSAPFGTNTDFEIRWWETGTAQKRWPLRRPQERPFAPDCCLHSKLYKYFMNYPKLIL